MRITASRMFLSRTHLSLIVIGCVSLVLYRKGLRAEGTRDIIWFTKLALAQAGLYIIAAWLILRTHASRSMMLVVIVFAALFRLSILFAPPYLSDDIYRYVWDGRVQAAGINPYRYIPAEQALISLRDESIYPKINRRDYAHTMYPPVAEAVYLLTTRVSESVTWMKATMVGFEALALWALASLLNSLGLPRQRILIYAWHPLVVWEFAGSGHLDAMMIAFLALALLAHRRHLKTATGIALACAVLVKLFPAILFPAFYRRWDWKMPLAFIATIIIGYLPYISVGAIGVLGFLPGYAGERGITTGEQFYLLNMARAFTGAQIPNAVFVVFALCLLLAVAGWCFWRPERDDRSYLRRAFVLASVFTILLTPHFSWYFSWLIPFLCLIPLAPLFYMTAASFMLYATWIGDKPNQMFVLNSAIYLPCALLCAVVLWNRRRRATKSSGQTVSIKVEEKSSHIKDVKRGQADSRMSDQISPAARVSVIIAALNEEETIAQVISRVPREFAQEIIVVDNGSEDRTSERAQMANARVVTELNRGYGRAFRAGLGALDPECEIVVFLDGDGSDCPELMGKLVEPIINNTHDFVLGSRIDGRREPGSMLFHQVFAGHMIGFLLRLLYGVRYTDMGPFRAIRRDALERLNMREETYGWPLEMQMKAARAGLRIIEVPVDYRRRAGGKSKISGNLRGTILASTRILVTLARIAAARR